jgi:hypothetical protein
MINPIKANVSLLIEPDPPGQKSPLTVMRYVHLYRSISRHAFLFFFLRLVCFVIYYSAGYIDSVPNIEDAPFALNALMLEQVFSSQDQLTNTITMHFVNQAVRESYKLLGSMDFLGKEEAEGARAND